MTALAETITPGDEYWDGNESLPFVCSDGGRQDAGFRGSAGDCVTRAVAIASGRPYAEVYAALSAGMGSQRKSKGVSARNGISVGRGWFKAYMRGLGFEWTPTMRIGEGCKTHLLKGELPPGRLVVAVSRHYTAVINGAIRFFLRRNPGQRRELS